MRKWVVGVVVGGAIAVAAVVAVIVQVFRDSGICDLFPWFPGC
jgi:hypothetical protein